MPENFDDNEIVEWIEKAKPMGAFFLQEDEHPLSDFGVHHAWAGKNPSHPLTDFMND